GSLAISGASRWDDISSAPCRVEDPGDEVAVVDDHLAVAEHQAQLSGAVVLDVGDDALGGGVLAAAALARGEDGAGGQGDRSRCRTSARDRQELPSICLAHGCALPGSPARLGVRCATGASEPGRGRMERDPWAAVARRAVGRHTMGPDAGGPSALGPTGDAGVHSTPTPNGSPTGR